MCVTFIGIVCRYIFCVGPRSMDSKSTQYGLQVHAVWMPSPRSMDCKSTQYGLQVSKFLFKNDFKSKMISKLLKVFFLF